MIERLVIERLAPRDASAASWLLADILGVDYPAEELRRLSLRADGIALAVRGPSGPQGVGVAEVGTARPAAIFGAEAMDQLRGRVGWLTQLAVQKELRGRGAGRALILFLADWMVKRGCDTLAAVAWVPHGSEPLLRAAGCRRIGAVPMPRVMPRRCPVCGPECSCTGALYTRDLSAAIVADYQRGRRWPATTVG